MFVTLQCSRCPRADLIEVLDCFSLPEAAALHNWRLTTEGLKGGTVVARDLCPDCARAPASKAVVAGTAA